MGISRLLDLNWQLRPTGLSDAKVIRESPTIVDVYYLDHSILRDGPGLRVGILKSACGPTPSPITDHIVLGFRERQLARREGACKEKRAPRRRRPGYCRRPWRFTCTAGQS